jgi:MFS family permease
VFGWLSDRVGRKYLLLLSMLLGIILFRPIFRQMHQVTNLQHKVENKSKITREVNSQISPGSKSLTTSTNHFYSDGTTSRDVTIETISAGRITKIETSKTIKLIATDKWRLIFLALILSVISVMSYGPLAAYLVEMFPLKIRYSSLSLPYHIGFGIFGGMAPLIATYLIQKANDAQRPEYYLAGLTYPIVLMTISLLIGLLYLKENKRETLAVPGFYKAINKIKKLLGMVWILLGLAFAFIGVFELGLPNIMTGKQDDLIFGLIMMLIITPVAAFGLLLFGIFALQGEYDEKGEFEISIPKIETTNTLGI